MEIKPKINYDFYICVLDFEATCDEDNSTIQQEIIEFPSVLYGWDVKTKGFDYISEFREYCKPKTNPILTKFCTQLTKITQDKIDIADSFPNVIQRHYKWLVSLIGKKTANEKVLVLTVGEWDIKTMLPKECKMWNISSVPNVYKYYINVKYMFQKVFKYNGKGMKSMLKELNLKLEGVHHSGLDDCKNTAKIVKKCIGSGYIFNESYDLQYSYLDLAIDKNIKNNVALKIDWDI